MKSEEESNALIEALRDAGYEPRRYSGRGMYGKECVGVSADSAFGIGKVLADTDVPEPREDQLGRSMIYYWPSYPWPQ